MFMKRIKDNWSSAATEALVSIFVSLMNIVLWQTQNMVVGRLNLVMAGVWFGYALRSVICDKFHTRKSMEKYADQAMRSALVVIDAELIAKGCRPLSDVLRDSDE
jgi:hypothetical protein